MTPQIIQMFLICVVCIFVFEEVIFAEGQVNQEIIEHGRSQYQLLKERSNLPRSGSCWKAAIEHLDEGCKHLSEESQSHIALHITNCFLEMSGHKTYSCEHDKKPNLRAICISSMSDRAFNVYTEFYTQTQNICWFLRGQIWQETIYENTWKVGKQLELTASNQEGLLRAQKESLELQEKMLKHGRNLEQVLETLHESSNVHRNILMMLSKSIDNLQSWIIGEVSWIDSVVFYMVSVFVTVLLTSSQRTMSSRIPISVLLFFNLILERMICSFITSDSKDINILSLYLKIYDFIWYSRYAFVCLATITFLYKSVYHTDIHFKNNEILQKIHSQNLTVLNALDCLKHKLLPESNGTLQNPSFHNDNLNLYSKKSPNKNNSNTSIDIKDYDKSCELNYTKFSDNYIINETKLRNKGSDHLIDRYYFNGNIRNNYNLRSSSRQGTPDC